MKYIVFTIITLFSGSNRNYRTVLLLTALLKLRYSLGASDTDYRLYPGIPTGTETTQVKPRGAASMLIDKTQEGRWIWGYVIENKTAHPNEKFRKVNVTTNDGPNDPCKPYNPERPSFKAPGRRISEEKCEEYIWGIRLRREQMRRDDECQRVNVAKNKFNGSYGAAGGVPVFETGQYPHMGALGWKTKIDGEYVFKCGSTLISSKFLLTAAHCSNATLDDIIIDSSPKIVRLIYPNLVQLIPTNDVNIIRKILHPNYKPPKQYYDIALMELEYDVMMSNAVRPACLWTKDDVSELGVSAKLTGWGVLRFGSREMSPDLRVAEVNFIDSKFCDEMLSTSRNRNWQGLAEHQLCAGKLEGGVDACQGDSGGPLQVIKFRLESSVLYNVVGVTSFGIGCAQPNLPGIYTRVSSFIDWIEDIVWKDGLQ